MKDKRTGKTCKWNEEKNKILWKERGLRFEMLDGLEPFYFIEKHNPLKYPRQDAYIYDLDGYPVFVPYVEEKEYLFFKNMIHKREFLPIYHLLVRGEK